MANQLSPWTTVEGEGEGGSQSSPICFQIIPDHQVHSRAPARQWGPEHLPSSEAYYAHSTSRQEPFLTSPSLSPFPPLVPYPPSPEHLLPPYAQYLYTSEAEDTESHLPATEDLPYVCRRLRQREPACQPEDSVEDLIALFMTLQIQEQEALQINTGEEDTTFSRGTEDSRRGSKRSGDDMPDQPSPKKHSPERKAKLRTQTQLGASHCTNEDSRFTSRVRTA